MPGPFGAAIISTIGSLLGAGLGVKGQSDANRTNVMLAREQMAFQERMAHSAESFSERMRDTQVQARVKDLIAAGLNPALAYEGSAAAPAGVMAGGSQARVDSKYRDLPNIAANAMSMVTMKAQLDQIKEQTALIRTQKEKTSREGRAVEITNDINSLNYHNLLQTQPADIRRRILETALLEAGLPTAQLKGGVSELLQLPLRGWKSLTELLQRSAK